MVSVERVVTNKVVGDPDEPWHYWLMRPIEERIDSVEELRREHHGWVCGSEPRLPRVLEIVLRHDVCYLAAGGRTSGRFEIGFCPSGLASESCVGEK